MIDHPVTLTVVVLTVGAIAAAVLVIALVRSRRR